MGRREEGGVGRRREEEDKTKRKMFSLGGGLFLLRWSVLLFVVWLVLKNL